MHRGSVNHSKVMRNQNIEILQETRITNPPDVVDLRLYVTAPVATAEDTPTPWLAAAGFSSSPCAALR
jgi:hypothetical protein